MRILYRVLTVFAVASAFAGGTPIVTVNVIVVTNSFDNADAVVNVATETVERIESGIRRGFSHTSRGKFQDTARTMYSVVHQQCQ